MRRVTESYKSSGKESTAICENDENVPRILQDTQLPYYFAIGKEAADFVRISSWAIEGAS
jgi:hypothetical protein